MKNLIFITTLLIVSCAAQAQNKVEKIISYSVPKGTEKPDGQQFQSYLDKRKNTTMSLKVRSGDFFKSEDILIYINAAEGKAKPDRLEETKRQYDIMFSDPDNQTYSSEIKTINGIKVLINHLIHPNFNYYTFTAMNSTGSKLVTGRLEFPKTDESKAKTVLYTIISSIKFK